MDAQRDFALAFVVESDRLLSASELTFYNALARHFGTELPVSHADPVMRAGSWFPVSRFFGEGSTWRTRLPAPGVRVLGARTASGNESILIDVEIVLGLPGVDMRLADLLKSTDRYIFRDLPAPVPSDLRPGWRIATLLLALDLCCHAKKSSLSRIHVLSWAVRSPESRSGVLAFLDRDVKPDSLVVRIEPYVIRFDGRVIKSTA